MHQVMIMSYSDLFHLSSKDEDELFGQIDVFIGLAHQWEKEEKLKKHYVNPLLNTIWETYCSTIRANNVLCLEMNDGGLGYKQLAMARGLLDAGYKIGFGCYAAHGRTGWLLAKLIKHYEKCNGDIAVRAVRARLCKKCVETKAQTDDLGCKIEQGHYVKQQTHQGTLYGGHGYGNGALSGWKNTSIYTNKDGAIINHKDVSKQDNKTDIEWKFSSMKVNFQIHRKLPITEFYAMFDEEEVPKENDKTKTH